MILPLRPVGQLNQRRVQKANAALSGGQDLGVTDLSLNGIGGREGGARRELRRVVMIRGAAELDARSWDR